MLIPIQAARAAAASPEEAGAKTQQSVALMPAAQRGEAIQKILDALTRHLSGREILSKDALVRLMEDLARILKFPPLPQEGGRDFVRRLVAFLETMPPSDRLLLERQLGGRSLALRVGLLADLPAVRNGATMPGTATPMPAQARDVILRNPSLQPAMPLNPGAARAAMAGEVALLQAVLRRTFSVGNDSDVHEAPGDGAEHSATPDTLPQSRADKTPARTETRSPATRAASEGDTPVAAALLAGEGEVEEATPQAPLRSEAGETSRSTATHSEAATDTAASDQAASEAPVGAEATEDAESPETIEDQDPDGTYGPLPDTDEEGGRKATPAAAGRGEPEARAVRVLSEAIKTLIRDSVALPGSTSGTDTKPMPGEPDLATIPLPAPAEETGLPAREGDAAMRRREAPDGSSPLPSLLDDRTEEPATAQRAAAETRPQRPVDEQTMQQVIAKLVEAGLPREAIPFTMIPYPPATNDKTETEDLSRGMTGGSGEDASAEDEGTDEGSEQEGGEPSGEASEDEMVPETPDAYDLYRKLGGLG